MRVAFDSFPDSLVGQLALLSAQQTQLQNQVATGKRISQLEDDPAAMRRVLDWQAQNSRLAQYRQNISALQERATTSYNAIAGLQKLSARAGEIATLADGTKSAQELGVYASEVNQLIQQGVQLMNGQDQGDYLFGGTQTAQAPFVTTSDAAGDVTAVAYAGNEAVPSAEVASGCTLSVQAPGANTSGNGPAGVITDSRSGADFFNHLIALRNHLQAGDTEAIAASDRGALAKDEDNITTQMAANGLVQSQLNDADAVASTQSSAINQMISQESDVDLAQTLTRLATTQTAYQAALQSGASLLNSNLSLMDYIR